MIADENYHQVIEPHNPMMIECIENTPIYCKIPSKFKYCPLKIRLKYENRTDLKIYLSFTNKMPDAKNAYATYNRPRMIKIWAEGREKKFTCDYIYLAFHSLAGASLDILATFTSEEEALGKKTTDEGKNEKGLTTNQSKVIEQYAKSNEKALENKDTRSKIQRNMEVAFRWRTVKEQQMEESKLSLDRKLVVAKSIRK